MVKVLLLLEDYNELVFLQTLLRKLGVDVDALQTDRKLNETLLTFRPQVFVTTARGHMVDGLAVASKIRPGSSCKILVLKTSSMKVEEADLKKSMVDRVLESPVHPTKFLEAICDLAGVKSDLLTEKYNKVKHTLGVSEGPEERKEGGSVKPLDNEKSDFQVVKGGAVEAERAKVYHQGESLEPKKMDESIRRIVEQMPNSQPVTVPPFENLEGFKDFKVTELQPSLISADARLQRHKSFAQTVECDPKSHFSKERIQEFNRMIRSSEDQEELLDLERERQAFVKALFKKK